MHDLSLEAAWTVLRQCTRAARQRRAPCRFAWRDGQLQRLAATAADTDDALLHWDGLGQWRCVGEFRDAVADLLQLYLPFCAASAVRPITIAHLGQSLDGYVATSNGDSCFVNDAQNIVHLHRMRALCDAIVVGGATVRDDDPQLTTRLVSGDSPLRVIIDPQGQLDDKHLVFTDGAAATLLVTLDGMSSVHANFAPHVQVLRVGADANGHPDLPTLMKALHQRGCRAVFVEGGGITVSRFMQAGLLDRLQLAVAPLFIGEGRAGLRLAAQPSLQDCLRPAHRLFRMGSDLLFDCDLRTASDEHARHDNSDRTQDESDARAGISSIAPSLVRTA